ncbi:MAG: hypothetical protein Q8N98_01665, partial [bacterium]|nr:hypothetical protein [bacterium]
MNPETPIRFSKSFYERYVGNKGEMERIQDLMDTRPPRVSLKQELVRTFPSLPREIVARSLIDTQQEVTFTRLRRALEKIISPQLLLVGPGKPVLQSVMVIELARRANTTPNEAINWVKSSKPLFPCNGDFY